MKPTETLMHEHTIVLKMLDGAERFSQEILSSKKVDVIKLEKIIDFSRNFTDGCHHSKEEKHFFVKLQERGMSKDHGPIAVMLYEHGAGRENIREIEKLLNDYKSGGDAAVVKIAEVIKQYIALLRSHIAKENNVLFPMGDKLLSGQDQSDLSNAFDKLEETETGKGEHEKFHKMAHEI
jgi:hemerythrin-like domain-containing protein